MMGRSLFIRKIMSPNQRQNTNKSHHGTKTADTEYLLEPKASLTNQSRALSHRSYTHMRVIQ